ncbi:G-protein coupled receptor dmsr-1-like isoform X2 [Cylas formicarius]|uniref:G-protein coupled receptor dmsr-1-like isoform X2 n=1 Tax=Cylas formicarius TaxID=197179 RepID=UPI002958B796|nr:G-protein coupled receptor dmsr-1-like isoform X2 [Cylas formicarius]
MTSYCNLKQFSLIFRSYHVYLSLTVCSLGSILNILNIFVLTTKPMRCPTNYILTALAVADVLVMLEYIPFSYLQDKSSIYFSHEFASFIIFHSVFTNAFHFISCSLATILAVWRYVAVKYPQNNQKWCGETRTKLTICFTYILCSLVCIPLILSMEVKSQDAFETPDGSVVFNDSVDENNTELRNITIYITGYKNTIFRDISFYVYGVVLKLIPCILLSILSVLLIVELFRAKQRKKVLLTYSNGRMTNQRMNQKHLEKERQFNRTTKMLLAVLLLFLMAEFPQAIMGLLHPILGYKFYKECYVALVLLIHAEVAVSYWMFAYWILRKRR